MNNKAKANLVKKLLINLPNEIIVDILENTKTILDWGSALGYGTNEIKKFFNAQNVYGQDISKIAIQKAKEKFKDIEFIESNQIINQFDVIINSNTLEHFTSLVDIISEHLKHTSSYYIVLAPYKELPLSIHHLITTKEDTFPSVISNFEKIYQKEVVFQNKFWQGNQLLIVYKNTKNINENIAVNCVDTWDKVADTYTSEIDDIDIEISEYILSFYKQNKLQNTDNIIELGCGSGHISLQLKKSGIENVNLLDFSLAALEKAKLVFNEEKANFIYGDLLKLDLSNKYDICWNSGVLEHFNDEELTLILKNIYKITNKYFICIVPNPKSLIYLLMRRNRMVNNTWSFGIEYLRTNYEGFFNEAGFKIKQIDYIGKGFSKYFLKEVFMDRYDVLNIDDLLINELYLKENNYLQVFICEV